jgi:hypothetical protein
VGGLRGFQGGFKDFKEGYKRGLGRGMLGRQVNEGGSQANGD